MAERANPRAERTRSALIGAGRRLYSERPVDAVTVDDIVQAAGVGKGSFYNHFADRDALVRAISSEIRGLVEAAVTRANAGVEDPARRMARAVCTYLRFALDGAESAGVLVRIHSGHTSLSAPLNRGLVEDIETGLASGRFAVATVEAGVLYVLGVTQLALVRVVQEPTLAFAVSLSQQMCALILRGLGVAGPEADLIAAQASDEIVRKGAFSAAAKPTEISH
ncbi:MULTISPECIES: TetR/AcrR family transcriptional regulator [unclassified Phenylobacterium]|uniref:TetR/AcrR family transcriptional regulator n=1 Tax=unclassified Phenylobacterium TaxID=2640670 RepID=UPI00083A1FB3|nr:MULTISPECIES: TetR/AcrR family transcriptional regulator [unclassified Phenylobacterium]